MQSQQLVANGGDSTQFHQADVQSINQPEQLRGVEAVAQVFQRHGVHFAVRCKAEGCGRNVDPGVFSVSSWLGLMTRSEPAGCWSTESWIQGSGGRLGLRFNPAKRLTLRVR